jgi:hypothetical protein
LKIWVRVMIVAALAVMALYLYELEELFRGAVAVVGGVPQLVTYSLRHPDQGKVLAEAFVMLVAVWLASHKASREFHVALAPGGTRDSALAQWRRAPRITRSKRAS